MISYPRNHYFSGLLQISVKQFDDIYQELEQEYEKHEIKRLTYKRKGISEREVGAGRPFKIDLRNRFLMILTTINCTSPTL